MDTRIIIGATGVIVGAGISAFVTWKLLKKHYEEITQEEINSVKRHYAKLFKEGEHADLSSLVSKYKTRVDSLGYSGVQSGDSDITVETETNAPSRTVVTVEVETDDSSSENEEVHNIWRLAKDNPHPEDEAYVITFEQFNEEHDDYDKGDLTYYEGDDILVDSQESPIDDVEALIGPDALTRFGDNSGSKDIVYVRNDHVSMDFEISRDERSYTTHIAGIQEPKRRRAPKMRDDE